MDESEFYYRKLNGQWHCFHVEMISADSRDYPQEGREPLEKTIGVGNTPEEARNNWELNNH